MHGLQQLQLSGSAVVEPGLSGSMACGVLVPQPGIEPASPAPAGGFLTPGPSGKSPLYILSEMPHYLSVILHFCWEITVLAARVWICDHVDRYAGILSSE